MNLPEIAREIQSCYGYVVTPHDTEVEKILKEVSLYLLNHSDLTELELFRIINANLSVKTVVRNDSIDMTASLSILSQILKAATSQEE